MEYNEPWLSKAIPVMVPPWVVSRILATEPSVFNALICPLLTPTKRKGSVFTVTSCDAVPVSPPVSVAITLTVKIPVEL